MLNHIVQRTQSEHNSKSYYCAPGGSFRKFPCTEIYEVLMTLVNCQKYETALVYRLKRVAETYVAK
jgi:hypothetical protein